jgi:hypothetical protein
MARAEPADEAFRVGSTVKVRDDEDALRWQAAQIVDIRVGASANLVFLVDIDGRREWRSVDDVSPMHRQAAQRAQRPQTADASAAGRLVPPNVPGNVDPKPAPAPSPLKLEASSAGAEATPADAPANAVAAPALCLDDLEGGEITADEAKARAEAVEANTDASRDDTADKSDADSDADSTADSSAADDADADADADELQLNEAVVARWGRGSRALELDAIVVDADARAERLLVEFLWDHSKAWLGRACVRLMPAADDDDVPAGLRAGCAVEAVDPCDIQPSAARELQWHAARVVEVKVGVQAARESAGSLWFWVRYEQTSMHQWLSAEQLCAPGEAHVSARVLHLVSAVRQQAMAAGASSN